MLNTMLTAGGWTLFYLVILLWVGWISLERAHFAGQDPGAWRPDAQLNDRPTERPGAASSLGSPFAASSVARPT
jgi:hypothetical protein